MLARLREKIRGKKGVYDLLLEAKSFLEKRFYGPTSFTLSFYLHLKSRSTLGRLIRHRRVLIVGSGPSASDLLAIPPDLLVFTCNRGLLLFLDGSLKRRVDLYLCQKGAINDRQNDIETLLASVKTNLFLMNKPDFITEKTDLQGAYVALLQDKLSHNYYLRRLIAPYRVSHIRGQYAAFTSSGMRLLQYALFFKAKETYLIGVDLDQSGYFWEKKNVHWHQDIDRR
ncbi:MAG: hypothetical protein SWE60_18310, partial [Thermodesulfobacteriota bacterium]|nr:hypothetical protein [Thermodesulfobacteriota bacterium]